MTGIDLEEVHDLIVGAFQDHEFRRLLRYRLEIDLRAEVGNVGFSEAVEVILDKVKGRGLLPQLIAEVAQERPHRPDIQDLYRRTAAALVSEVKRKTIDAQVVEAYAKFGLAPPVNIQKGGVDGGTVPATTEGLERTVRAELGELDVGRWRGKLVQLEGRVCRVEVNDPGGMMGTGFLVGLDALLTNYHVLEKVIEGQQSASAVRFRFDYKTLPGGGPSDGVVAALADAKADGRPWLLGHGKYSAAEKADTPDAAPPEPGELDYALVCLDRKLGDEPVQPSGPARGWIEVPTVEPALAGLPALLILQHPRSEPLKLAFDTNPRIELKHQGLRVRYTTNTAPGASGSPCFDRDWKLVALHHYGDPAYGSAKYNQGIPIWRVREHLGDAGKAALGGAGA